jgi:hypothetical protein
MADGTYVASSCLKDGFNSSSHNGTSRGRAPRHGDRLGRLRVQSSGEANDGREDDSELE